MRRVDAGDVEGVLVIVSCPKEKLLIVGIGRVWFPYPMDMACFCPALGIEGGGIDYFESWRKHERPTQFFDINSGVCLAECGLATQQ